MLIGTHTQMHVNLLKQIENKIKLTTVKMKSFQYNQHLRVLLSFAHDLASVYSDISDMFLNSQLMK